MHLLPQIFFYLFMVLAIALKSPPIALLLGLTAALTFGNPFLVKTQKAIKLLLQVSVVGLGFGMNLEKVLQAGLSGFGFTFFTIAVTLLVGIFLGRWLGLVPRLAYLISAGTAICGGSAIAAVGPVVKADQNEMSVSLGTVFILNSIALLLFPVLGHLLGLSQQQFGIWSAIAIHDTSSVVGAASKYGDAALEIATTIKLARALWIVPLTLFTSYYFARIKDDSNKSVKVAIPYFIMYFVIASVLRTYVPAVSDISPFLVNIAKSGLNLTLYFIGASLSVKALKAVGVKPLIHGFTLWILISGVSLAAVLISKTVGQ